jgi:hypothetical protein
MLFTDLRLGRGIRYMQARLGIPEFRLCYFHLLIQPLEDLMAFDFEICSSHLFQPRIFEMPLMLDLNRHLR